MFDNDLIDDEMEVAGVEEDEETNAADVYSQLYSAPAERSTIAQTSASAIEKVSSKLEGRTAVDQTPTGPVNSIPNRLEDNNTCTGFKGPEQPRRAEINKEELKFDRVFPAEKMERIGAKLEAANIAEFQTRWMESMKNLGLEKGPLGPVLTALGDQLAAGKLDVAKLQQLMKGVSISEEDLAKVSRTLRALNENLQEMYGFTVNVSFNGKGDKVGVGSLTVEQAGGNHNFNTSVRIEQTGDAKAKSEFIAGYAGPIVTELTAGQGMTRLRNQIAGGRQDGKR